MAVLAALVPWILAWGLCGAVRLGEDSDELGQNQPPKSAQAEAAILHKYFSQSHKFSPTRQEVAEAQDKDGDGSFMKFEYLNTTCLLQRAKWAAKQFSKAGCTRLLEVGGYLTPFPKATEGAEDEWDKNLEIYVNVDPSAKETKIEDFGKNYAAVTLQLVLKEFADALKDNKGMHKLAENLPFDCFLMLGVWDTQVGSEEKRAALSEVVKHAKMAILESPQSDPNGRKYSEPVMKDSGFSIIEEKTVDCSQDEDALKKNQNDENYKLPSLRRDMVLYQRDSSDSGESTSSSTSDSSDSTGDSGGSSSSDSDSSGNQGGSSGESAEVENQGGGNQAEEVSEEEVDSFEDEELGGVAYHLHESKK
eukprot:TRINITY_DN18953_c0_g1_i1.p1 TRINITY_DN18953_c0_g1~~TRINITY_DN18953_c0_g1_i1.p1  ORF type:complete len:363 (+),score=106.23 TRINITY_DN18953_c0_g1_i1:89-1177(+)